MFHVVTSCPQTKQEAGCQRLYTAEDAAIKWFVNARDNNSQSGRWWVYVGA